jgi:hypothetical protein
MDLLLKTPLKSLNQFVTHMHKAAKKALKHAANDMKDHSIENEPNLPNTK